MSLSPIQLETRIQELVEGVLDEAHWPELRTELMHSPEARALYAAHVRMHSVLERRVKGLKAVLAHESLVPVEQLEKTRHRKTLHRAALAAAAALVIAASLMWAVLLTPSHPPIAFEATSGSRFTLSHSEGGGARKGQELGIGSRLVLEQGALDLTFGSGVRSIVRGPADFTLTSENRLRLDEGIAWFRVPEKAVGFRVTTPELEATDLGTEFGVVSKPGEADKVHVFDGRVEVAARTGSKARQTLSAGRARKTTMVGTLAAIDTNADRFLTKLPDFLPYLHWSFDDADPTQWRTRGNLAPDSGTGIRTGAHQGTPDIESGPGRFGRALVTPDFDSFVSSDRIGPDGQGPFTLAYWLKVEPRSSAPLEVVVLGWGTRIETPGGEKAFLTHLNPVAGGNAVGTTLGKVWWRGTTPIDDGQWHHHAVVHTGRHTDDGDPEVICYLDGRREPLVRSDTSPTDRDADGNIPVVLETRGPIAAPITFFASDQWQGQANPHDARLSLDEVFLIEGALSPDELRGLRQLNQLPDPSKEAP